MFTGKELAMAIAYAYAYASTLSDPVLADRLPALLTPALS